MTNLQLRLLTFLSDRIRKTGVCPSYEEMRVELGLGSKSGIVRLVDLLAAQGRILRRRNSARSLVVLTPTTGLTQEEMGWCHAHAGRVRRLIRGEGCA